MKVEPGCKALAQDVVLLLTLGVSDDSLKSFGGAGQSSLVDQFTQGIKENS